MKNGAPISAVIIPTGISLGSNIFLAIVSARSRTIPPLTADTGRSILLSGPVSYTHLDVYKRQVLLLPENQQAQ